MWFEILGSAGEVDDQGRVDPRANLIPFAWDLPLSFVADLALLPVTIPCELFYEGEGRLLNVDWIAPQR